MQEMWYHGCINVTFSRCNKSDIIVSSVYEAHSRQLDYWGLLYNLCGNDLITEIQDLFSAITKQSLVTS